MTYRERIYNMCKETDFNDPVQGESLAKFLARELMNMHTTAMNYEKKLKQLMTAEDFDNFSLDLAKVLFRQEIEGMDDSDFKKFALENIDEIMKEVGDEW